jgi:hypothetical protein
VGASLSGKGGPQSRKARGLDHRPTWDVFLTHDWGPEFRNHGRVKRVCAALEASGYSCWLDEAQLRRGADIGMEAQMAAGIDSSAVVIVFITSNYIAKASGLAPSGGDDNCHYEFTYACRRKGEAMIVPVVMETGCRDTSTWSGLGKLHGTLIEPRLATRRATREWMRNEPRCGRARCATSLAFFAGNKFVDLSGGAEAWDTGLPRLVRHIKAALAVAGGARRRRTAARVGWSIKPRASRIPTQEPRERTPPRDRDVVTPAGPNANNGFTENVAV